jgi:hypothetical protein
MKAISVGGGHVALIDDEDFPRVSAYKWHTASSYGKRYAVRKQYIKGGKGYLSKQIFLHLFIMPAPEGMTIDHINGNSLDNRKANLRPASHLNNSRNAKLRRDNTTGFKGVRRLPNVRTPKWAAGICVNGHPHHLGVFTSPEEAARAYDEAARKYFGEYARLNFPTEGEQSTQPRAITSDTIITINNRRPTRVELAKAYSAQRRAETVCEVCGAQPIEWHSEEHIRFPRRRVAHLTSAGRPIDEIEAEIQACAALCRRCHMEEDRRILNLELGRRKHEKP